MSCPVCGVGVVAPAQLTCKRCWWRVPLELRNAVWATWKRRQKHPSERKAIEAHESAKRLAIDAAKTSLERSVGTSWSGD